MGSKGEPTLLVRSLRDAFKTVPVIGVLRKYWEEQASRAHLPLYC